NELLANLLDLLTVIGGLLLLLLQILESLAQSTDLLFRQRPGLAEDLRLDAAAGNMQAGRAVEIPPTQLHLESVSVAAPGRVDIANVRRRNLRPSRGRRGQGDKGTRGQGEQHSNEQTQ